MRNQPAFELNLRLPGQVFDAETGSSYNYLRDYDPRLGRYTTPDPIGLDGGLQPYTYVGANPLTAVDPLGLYEEDVHYYATYFLGLAAGLSPTQAWTIASADRYIDDNPATQPYNYEARIDYHFTQGHSDPRRTPGESDTDFALRRVLNPTNDQLTNLRGYALNARVSPCAKAQLYGEYLHAFQDTFAHRDQVNQPYFEFIGHLRGGHNPDKTFNHVVSLGDLGSKNPPSALGDWGYNASRTIAMDQGTFEMLQRDFGLSAAGKDAFPIEWKDIRVVLEKFNADAVSPFAEITADQALHKAGILQARLDELGLGQMVAYNCSEARDQRLTKLTDKTGAPLDQKNFEHAILATPAKTAPCMKTN